MTNKDTIDIINNEIFKSLGLLELKPYKESKNFFPWSISYDVDITDFHQIYDVDFHDAPLLNFIGKTNQNDELYSLNILNYQGSLAIKKLSKNIFNIIETYMDLSLIREFTLGNSNIVNGVEFDFFKPIENSLQKIAFSGSYLPEIHDGLFNNLKLTEFSVIGNVIRQCDSVFGLSKVAQMDGIFWFTGNDVKNSHELKLKDFVKKYNFERTKVEF